ncbi:unnamed protein product [Bursaphelenchus okinawaensis]|uniref:G-protein coupled receptors family 1 profile domain-containing protein n=1 Tax=Bursaphelenchus okinawaensis TaxID=465554 RepID=A0A811K7F3_9BILA|nr:unnamed protein product [Bursaphelenchus okinawaensis]CAG9094128.1 unnamed protein product [Bursaphelenchus okinawaensis]
MEPPDVLTTCVVASVYALTVKVGLLGNCWVVSSVMKSRRPRNTMGSLSPSDRLRTYIGLLAILDLLVIGSLVIRVVYILLPYTSTQETNCRVAFVIDHLVKLASLTCLACISMERYITIRKPFSSRIRKRFIQLTPVVALTILVTVLIAIGILACNVGVGENEVDCQQNNYNNVAVKTSRWIILCSFFGQLLIVSANYGQIVRHVRRKFWQRKARVVANAKHQSKQPLVSQPRYMRDMTAAIVRIACFHVICWLPYCVMQMVSEYYGTELRSTMPTNLKSLEDRQINSWTWTVFVADWLTYVNSAGNWILYAAMNKDLRSIIRATTERRKRSTMSQSSPPSNIHRSLRRHMAQSLRFFYSINSYRSNNNSFDDSLTTCHANGSLDSSPMAVARSISNAGAHQGAEVGLFGMRNGRAHTYCSPRSSNGLSVASCNGSIHSPANLHKYVIASRNSPCSSPKPILNALLGNSNEKLNSQARYL